MWETSLPLHFSRGWPTFPTEYTSWRLIRRTGAKSPILRSPFHSESFRLCWFFSDFRSRQHLTTTPSRPLAFFVFHDLPVSAGVLNLRHPFAGESRDVISVSGSLIWKEKIGTETTCYSTFTTRTHPSLFLTSVLSVFFASVSIREAVKYPTRLVFRYATFLTGRATEKGERGAF